MAEPPTMPRVALAERRVEAMLRTAMGESIAGLLVDPEITEVMVNPDGRLWTETLGSGRSDTGITLRAQDTERIIRLVASHVQTPVGADAPMLSAELPGSGARFQGLLPPLVTQPMLTIRKHALRVFSLEDYLAQGAITAAQAQQLRAAVKRRDNLLIAGGTGSGKTTLANAILAEMAKTPCRIITIEDTYELQCTAEDTVRLRTQAPRYDMRALVKVSLRLRPDRIIVGEVRDGAALELLKSWNTGHPGGLSTVHSNGAEEALYRIEELVQEVVAQVPYKLIARAIDGVVFIERTRTGRRVQALLGVERFDPRQDRYVCSALGL